MLKKLEEIYLKETFQPTWMSLFVNPLYFIRKGLFKSIKSNAKYMKGKMLDFGCGSKPYKNLFDVKEYIGVDIEESGHSHKNENIDVFYDGKKIPFDDNSFDSVFSSEVFEHIFNLDDILKEINRVMKKDAKLLLTLPFVWDEHEVPYDFARYTSFGIKDILEKNGFQVIKAEKTTTYIETVFQMWNAYVSQVILGFHKHLKVFLFPFLIAPVTLLGILLSKILPDNGNFYHNNVIIAKKIK